MKIREITTLCVAGTALSLLLLTASCDRNNEAIQGKKIAVYVRAPNIREQSPEDLSRASSPQQHPSETIALAGGLLLDMRLEADAPSGLRSTPSTLEGGKNFRVIALNAADGTYVSHGDFEVGGSTSTPTLHVLENVRHDFICISYNSSDPLPAANFTVGEEPTMKVSEAGAGDLLYGKVSKEINAFDRELSFTLTHQLAQIRLMVDYSYNGWANSLVTVGGIYLYPYFAGAVMKLSDWSLSGGDGASTVRYFSNWAAGATPHTQSCDPATIFAKGTETSIIFPVNSITVQGKKYPSEETRMPLSVFSPGNNYTLRLTLRIPRWAGSNIYWDNANQRLTFDLEGNTQNQHYQGVFFRWGSLVGISPARTSRGNGFNVNVPVYQPDYNAAEPHKSIWTCIDTTTYTAWTTTLSGVAVDTTEIPYLDDRPEFHTTESDRANTYAIDAERNTATMYLGMRGDICQYLGQTIPALYGYRLPTGKEFSPYNGGDWDKVKDGWEKGDGFVSNSALGDKYGTATFPDPVNNWGGYAKNTNAFNLTLPASGSRSSTSGGLLSIGNAGLYWTGSAYESTRARHLSFSNSSISPNGITSRSTACPIRCVKN
jgi:hypothetical protein